MSRSDDAIEAVDAPALAAAASGVRDLLADGVASGASLGFLGPLKPGLARGWVDESLRQVEAGSRLVWLARPGDGALSGMVHLELAAKENAPHRAEVQKLIVRRDVRGRGLGSRLMAALEARARVMGRWLLVLDTDAGSPAVAFYTNRGWCSLGVIPTYCLSPGGELQGTHVFWRDLRERP